MAIVRRQLKSGRASWWVVVRYAGKSLWRRVDSQAEAKAKERIWKEQIAEGVFSPVLAMPSSPTLAQYIPVWTAQRDNRTATKDAQMMRDHVLPYGIAKVKLSEVRPRHTKALVDDLRAKGLSDKSISNVLGALHTLFRDALIAEFVYTQPVVLPKRTLKRTRAEDPEIYQPAECRALMANKNTDPRARLMWALGLCAGLRQGEIVGRQWKDFRAAAGLQAMHVRTQYDGQPLKTDRPRVVPVHPVLEQALMGWADIWAMLMGRAPRPEDFVIPDPKTERGLTKNQSYKMLRASAETAGVPWHGVHSTRHTFITLARRGGANITDLEKVTHNARGGIVDGYTRQDWEPLCDVVRRVSFDSDQRIELPGENPGKNPFLPRGVKASFSAKE